MANPLKILVCGLPGAGKTTLAQELILVLSHAGKTVEWFNADEIRGRFNDWDFSEVGRIRQAERMRDLANQSQCDYVIADFVAPLPEMRDLYSADWVIWLDTIAAGRFDDTNRVFTPPVADFRIRTQDALTHARHIANTILNDRFPTSKCI